MPVLYSVGHSNHSIEKFLGLLGQHEIRTVCDVRSQPHSEYSPQFNRDNLSHSLGNQAGITYVFMGDGLGARITDPKYHVDGRVSFEAAARRPAFIDAIAKLMMLASSRRVALMCTEKDPIDCHRTILVARSLVKSSCDVLHILPNGALESHGMTIQRLSNSLAIEPSLFSPPGDEFDSAYSAQEQKIAWKVR